MKRLKAALSCSKCQQHLVPPRDMGAEATSLAIVPSMSSHTRSRGAAKISFLPLQNYQLTVLGSFWSYFSYHSTVSWCKHQEKQANKQTGKTLIYISIKLPQTPRDSASHFSKVKFIVPLDNHWRVQLYTNTIPAGYTLPPQQFLYTGKALRIRPQSSPCFFCSSLPPLINGKL